MRFVSVYWNVHWRHGWWYRSTMVFEVVDNSIDEALLAGHCNDIIVTIHEDRFNGIRYAMTAAADHSSWRILPEERVCCCDNHLWRFFCLVVSSMIAPYKVSGGLHGVMLSIIKRTVKQVTLTATAVVNHTQRTTMVSLAAPAVISDTDQRIYRKSVSGQVKRHSQMYFSLRCPS